MTKKQISDIKKLCRDIFTMVYLRPAANVFGDVFDAIDIFVNKVWDTDDCEALYFFMEEQCQYSTAQTCIKVREFALQVANVYAGDEPCEACPFNIFCSYVYNQTDDSWHFNMIRISDRLGDIMRAGEITQTDRDYVDLCYSRMISSNQYQQLQTFLDAWDI